MTRFWIWNCTGLLAKNQDRASSPAMWTGLTAATRGARITLVEARVRLRWYDWFASPNPSTNRGHVGCRLVIYHKCTKLNDSPNELPSRAPTSNLKLT